MSDVTLLLIHVYHLPVLSSQNITQYIYTRCIPSKPFPDYTDIHDQYIDLTTFFSTFWSLLHNLNISRMLILGYVYENVRIYPRIFECAYEYENRKINFRRHVAYLHVFQQWLKFFRDCPAHCRDKFADQLSNVDAWPTFEFCVDHLK